MPPSYSPHTTIFHMCYTEEWIRYRNMPHIPDMYEAVIGKVRQLISSVKHLSCTTDAWSDPSSGVALLSLTAQWISDDFIRQQAVLFATPLEESHPGENISVKFTEMARFLFY